jgi:peptidoglycan/LPS O-acetylase OafA/YrhL
VLSLTEWAPTLPVAAPLALLVAAAAVADDRKLWFGRPWLVRLGDASTRSTCCTS